MPGVADRLLEGHPRALRIVRSHRWFLAKQSVGHDARVASRLAGMSVSGKRRPDWVWPAPLTAAAVAAAAAVVAPRLASATPLPLATEAQYDCGKRQGDANALPQFRPRDANRSATSSMLVGSYLTGIPSAPEVAAAMPSWSTSSGPCRGYFCRSCGRRAA
jgi:hypothetical protein